MKKRLQIDTGCRVRSGDVREGARGAPQRQAGDGVRARAQRDAAHGARARGRGDQARRDGDVRAAAGAPAAGARQEGRRQVAQPRAAYALRQRLRHPPRGDAAARPIAHGAALRRGAHQRARLHGDARVGRQPARAHRHHQGDAGAEPFARPAHDGNRRPHAHARFGPPSPCSTPPPAHPSARLAFDRSVPCERVLACVGDCGCVCVCLQVYDASRGAFVDLGVLDVMQIFGRAGRPQFDTAGGEGAR
eukprot:4170923-Pleurochrysis_carterae.AAC.3